jgi:glutamyl-tRNA synthetase
MLPFLVKAGLVSSPPTAEQMATVRRVIEASGDRLKVAGDILGYADFFLLEEPVLEPQAVAQKLAKPGVADLLARYAGKIAAVTPFESGQLEEATKAFVAEAGLKLGDVIHPVRVAITGKTVGPGLYDCLAILGASKSITRIDRAREVAG